MAITKHILNTSISMMFPLLHAFPHPVNFSLMFTELGRVGTVVNARDRDV